MHHPTDRIAHTTAFVTRVVEHWLEREIAQWVHPMKDRSDDPSHHEQTLLPRSHISLQTASSNHTQTEVVQKGKRKEVFYLMTHSTHFIFRLCGVEHMVKYHSDSERGNPLPPHGLLFPISSKGSFICTIPQTG